MIQTHEDALCVLFGNKQYELSKKDIKDARYAQVLQNIVTNMSLRSLVILNQQHSAEGFCVDEHFLQKQYSLYEQQGDFLITNMKQCGLVILTADCLPIVLYDKKRFVAGVVHAGWKGAYNGVVLSAIKAMQERYHSDINDIDVLYGAGAKNCCYEVREDFYNHFERYRYAQKAFVKRDNKLYFDNKQFITSQLLSIGIKFENIYDKQTKCTICSLEYCSYRREKDRAGRQTTVVSLL